MARPTVTVFTERLYGRLPDVYRAADEAQAAGSSGYPLLRYLSLIADQGGEVEELLDRIDYVAAPDGGAPGDTSDLADPATADAAWLPWIAQAAGADLGDLTDPAGRRLVLVAADDTRADGSVRAVRARVAPLLTGARTLYVVPHYGNDWTVALITFAGESAGTTPEAILAAAEEQRPAGVAFVHEYGLTWDDLEAGFPTWSAIDAAGSWNGLTI